MGDETTRKLFTSEKQSEHYAKYRIGYPPATFEKIREYCAETSNDFELAVDVACGTGQGTVALAKFFKKVVGIDVSPTQIANCRTDVQNVSFQVGPAEDLSQFQNSSVDLVTIAQAFHYTNSELFFKEVSRILKPGGSFVIYGVGPEELSHPKLKTYLQLIMWDKDYLGAYLSERLKIWENYYENVVLPFPGQTRDVSVRMSKEIPIEGALGYIKSLENYVKYDKANPGHTLLTDMRNRMLELTGTDESKAEEFRTNLEYPVHMLMAHKPLSTC